MKTLNTLALAIAGISATSAFADSTPAVTTSKLEEMVVTAHRIEMPMSRIGSSVSVMTEADIEARGQMNVAELLRSVPAVAVSNNGGIGKATSLRIRGEESYRTVVYVDGVKISDPTATQVSPRFAHLMTSEIERIEVLRGPQGMMYGADAGGIVNIITKRPSETFEGAVNAEYGRYDTQNLSANVRGKLGGFDYSVSASDFSNDGFNARSDDIVDADKDEYDNTSLNATFGLDATDKLRLELVLRDVDSDNQYDGSSGTNDQLGVFEQTSGKFSAIYTEEAFTHKLSVSRNDVERRIIQDGVQTSWGIYEGRLDQMEYLSSYSFDENVLTFGVDVEEQLNERTNAEQDQYGFFAEWQAKLGDDLSYSVGVRHDDNDTFGEFTSYRLSSAYVQPVGDGHSIKYRASYGTGFRAPSLYEQWYNVDSGYSFGEAANTKLEEETSEGFDVGVEFHSAAGNLIEVVYFNQEIKNAIDFDVQSYSGYIQESGTSRSKGVELNAEWLVSASTRLIANATYNDTSDSEGDQRVRRPRKLFNLGVQSLVLDDKLRINADVRGSYGSIDNNGSQLDDYETMNLSATYFATEEVELYVRGENVFNADYEEISNYNTPKSAVYGGVRVRF